MLAAQHIVVLEDVFFQQVDLAFALDQRLMNRPCLVTPLMNDDNDSTVLETASGIELVIACQKVCSGNIPSYDSLSMSAMLNPSRIRESSRHVVAVSGGIGNG